MGNKRFIVVNYNEKNKTCTYSPRLYQQLRKQKKSLEVGDTRQQKGRVLQRNIVSNIKGSLKKKR